MDTLRDATHCDQIGKKHLAGIAVAGLGCLSKISLDKLRLLRKKKIYLSSILFFYSSARFC